MKLVKPHPQIYLFLGESAADLGKPFVRLQEFYENPSKIFRGKYFTLEKFKSWYSKHHGTNGKFTYYRDFFGYNVPGNIALKWLREFRGNGHFLLPEEEILRMAIDSSPKDFYIIGAPEKDVNTIDHELSHAFFYLFSDYRKVMIDLHRGHDLSMVRGYLKSVGGYTPDVYDDEITSCVMFDWPVMNRAGVRTGHLGSLRASMREIYDEYKSHHIR